MIAAVVSVALLTAADTMEVSLTAGAHTFNETRADWLSGQLVARRLFEQGSVAVEFLEVRRFERWDGAGAVDLWYDLWARAYGNLRLQIAPKPEVLPTLDGVLEIYQGFGQGFEVAVSYRLMHFAALDAHLFGLNVAHYRGDWYFAVRSTYALLETSGGASVGALARRYFVDADTFVELQGIWGSEVVTLGVDQLQQRQTGSVVCRGQMTIVAGLAAQMALTGTYEAVGPEGVGGTAGVMARF